jgi:uncharacterized protein YuzE
VTVTVGGVQFDRVSYDREADVLYLHAGDPASAVEFDESPEGHALRLNRSGRLVGVTLVNARKLLERDGRITVTATEPVWHLEANDLAEALGLAS